MGMYDTFAVNNVKCPRCGKQIESGQTKSFHRSLDYFKIGDKVPFRDQIFPLFIWCEDARAEIGQTIRFHFSSDIRAEIKDGIYIGELHGRTH